MPQTPGLRERKKQQTRRLIADTARRLFVAGGFDRVTVAEVAAAAEVSEATVFNYFPTKEDLFYSGLEAFEEEMLDAIRDRAAGESILAAFGRFVMTPRGLLAAKDPEATETLAAITRVITESAALLAREQRIFDRYTDSLADLIAEEVGAPAGSVDPKVVAHALIGVHRAVIDYSRREIVAGTRNPVLSRRVRAETKRALGLLEHGLGGYGVRR
jgi:AcrR family transcriptional regulator